MSAEERAAIKKKITFIVIIMLAAVVAYMIYGAVSGNMSITAFRIILAIWLLIYIVLMDIIEPKLLKEFENITEEQKSGYIKYLLSDIAGTAGLAFFIFSLGETNNQTGLFGAVVYIIALRFKRENRKIFYGEVEADVEETDAEGTDAQKADKTEAGNDESTIAQVEGFTEESEEIKNEAEESSEN